MIEINHALRKQMRSCGATIYKKFLTVELIRNWEKLFDAGIVKYVKPVAIEHGVLLVHVENSSFKDQLKFLAEEIIDTINKNFGQDELLVKGIRIAKAFQVANMPPEKKSSAKVEKFEIKLEDITLTDEEIKRCKEQSEKISDPKLREAVLNTLLTHARVTKFHLANGWHKCSKCESLCPPKEIFCDACRIQERESMVKALFEIFYDEPQLKTWEAQKILLEQMPHMKSECSFDAVESARTSLIQRIASRVRFGDEKSPDALKLVALERRLSPEKITPAIIKRTLFELRFDMAESPKFSAHK